MMGTERKNRVESALWGLFIADALAMPAHWYYNRDNIKRDFNGGIRSYQDAPHPHPESFMSGGNYLPDVNNAKALGRPYDILHEHTRFYRTTYTESEVKLSDRESEHGNAVAAKEERYHYHHSLKAGENTLGAHLVRVLMESVINNGGYDQKEFLEDFIRYLTSPHPDPYIEIYLREWFQSYTTGLPADLCAADQHEIWSIGSHGGMIRPMVLSLLSSNAYQGFGTAIAHQNLTHRSELVSSALSVAIPLLFDLINGEDAHMTIQRYAVNLRLPKITGAELFSIYRKHKGPGNIDKAEMYLLHSDLSDKPFDIVTFAELDDEEVINTRLATACYPEHGLPLLLNFLHKYSDDFKTCLLANANAGGDNVHRGMILGLFAGAIAGKEAIPKELITGLKDHEEIEEQIGAFSRLIQ